MNGAILIMGRAPRTAADKTRPEPAVGPLGCARLQAELLRHAAGWAAASGRPTWLAFDPPGAAAELEDIVPRTVRRFAQYGDDVGERLQDAVTRVASSHAGPVIVVGTDSPTIGPRDVDALELALAGGWDASLLATHDGGYAALALSRPLPLAFALRPSAWGGPDVLDLTLARLRRQGLAVAVLDRVPGLDTAEDVRRLGTDPACPERLRAALRHALECPA